MDTEKIKKKYGSIMSFFEKKRKYGSPADLNDWNQFNWHLKHCLTTQEDLNIIFPEIGEKVIELPKGYQFSFLPLNLFLGHDARQKWIPCDYRFGQHPTGRSDPYGIFQPEAIRQEEGSYIGSQKFTNTLLVNLSMSGKTLICPIGCASCYKGEFTREGRQEETFVNPVEQFKLLSRWLKKNPEVYDIILSGGEPLMLEDSQLKEGLKYLGSVESLKIIRICTGTLFLGLPFRITYELLMHLNDFRSYTRIQIVFQAHLAHPDNFQPETVEAIERINRAGFQINSQVPVLESVNFFRDDLEKTKRLWEELGWLQIKHGIRPYKYLPDVHARTDQFFVPLELILKVLVRMKESHDYPDLFWPTNFTIMTPRGNIPLHSQMLLTMKKEVKAQEGKVVYQIPATWLTGKQWIQYEEPLLTGYNDQPKIQG